MRLGFVGTGTMGAPMASCLLDAGHELTVYDVRPAATAALVARGVQATGSPAEVARSSEVVFTSLPGPREVERVALDPSSGILAGLAAGGAYIDMTTNAPAVARRIAEACRTRGIEMLDAPVSGRPPTMTVMAGGDAPVFAKYRPLLAAMAGNIFHVGEAGAGCTAKLVTQDLGYTNFVAALEGMLIGAKAGIDLAQLACIVPLSAGASRDLRQHPALRPQRYLYRRRHPRHRRQGPRTRLRSGARGRRPRQSRTSRPRRLEPCPGAGLGARRLSGRHQDPRSDGRL